jgi:FMN phosphatase YigB (HAD superfamily)
MIKAVIFDVGGTLFKSDSVEKDREVKAGQKLLEFFKKNGIVLKLTPQQVADAMTLGEKKFKQ